MQNKNENKEKRALSIAGRKTQKKNENRAAALVEQGQVRPLFEGLRQCRLRRPHEHHVRPGAVRAVAGDVPPRRGPRGGRAPGLRPPSEPFDLVLHTPRSLEYGRRGRTFFS